MTRGVWAALLVYAVCAGGVGCSGPQYYAPPQEKMPAPANVEGAAVQIIDQRPEWETKPFTGVVCLYHLGKSHPDAWSQLAEETNAVVAAMPQKPERVEVVVQSFRLVRSGDTGGRFRDFSAGPSPNPAARTQDITRTNREEREERLAAVNGRGSNALTDDRPGNSVELMFSAKDDPRRALREHPLGASCSIQAQVRMVFPGGREQTLDVKTIARGANDTGTAYWGEAVDAATKSAVFQFGRQFRAGVGMSGD